MTASSAKRSSAPARWIALARVLPLAALLPLAVPATAQDRPVTLAPPKPVEAAKPQPVEAQAPAPGIKVETLGEIDADSVGLLDAGAGGFGIAMWKGTPRSLVEAILPTLPGAPKSAAGRALYRRLLLSAAETPAGARGKGAPSLVAIRVNRLLAQGDVVSAQGLLRAVPQRLDDPAVALARAEVALLLNDNAGACAEVRQGLGQFNATFWPKAQVFCQLLAGDKAGATIGAGLLQEQGVTDAPFFALARMLAGDKGITVDGLDKPDPLHIAMMRAARVQIPPAVTTDGVPAVMRAVAQSPNADLDTRLEAAEQAEMRGAFEAEALRQLYLSVNFTPDELSGALSASEKLSGPRGRALLYRAARGQNVASAQAEIVARALALARKQGRLPTATRIMLPLIAAIEPSDDLAWFAADAGSALYVAGTIEAAAKWTVLAQSRAGASAKPKDGTIPAAAALWPLAQLAVLPPPKPAPVETAAAATIAVPPPAAVLDAAGFDAWWTAAAPLGDELRARLAVRLLSLAEALGAQVGDAPWAKLVTAPAAPTTGLPSAGLMAGLKRAGAAGRVGETALLALAALGAETPAKTDIRVLAPVVRALREAGLEEPARRLAVEAVFPDQ